MQQKRCRSSITKELLRSSNFRASRRSPLLPVDNSKISTREAFDIPSLSKIRKEPALSAVEGWGRLFLGERQERSKPKDGPAP